MLCQFAKVGFRILITGTPFDHLPESLVDTICDKQDYCPPGVQL